jgi:hypothetical protein
LGEGQPATVGGLNGLGVRVECRDGLARGLNGITCLNGEPALCDCFGVARAEAERPIIVLNGARVLALVSIGVASTFERSRITGPQRGKLVEILDRTVGLAGFFERKAAAKQRVSVVRLQRNGPVVVRDRLQASAWSVRRP